MIELNDFIPGMPTFAEQKSRSCEPELQEFPVECLPEPIRSYVNEIVRSHAVPASLVGTCVLGFISASLGAAIRLVSGPDRYSYGNLYLLVTASSGTGKSEVYRMTGRPFFERETALLTEWQQDVQPHLYAEKRIIESEIKGLESQAKKIASEDRREELLVKLTESQRRLTEVERELTEPVLTVGDVSVEKLAMLLENRGECLASVSADARKLVDNVLGRYNKLETSDEAIYLHAFSGDRTRIDRVTRPAVVLTAPRLTVLWLVQPDKLRTLLERPELVEGGLMPRFLLATPECQPQRSGSRPAPDAEVVRKYERLVCALVDAYRLRPLPEGVKTSFVRNCPVEADKLQSEVLTVGASPQAAAILNHYHDQIVDRRITDLQDVTSFAARWGEQAWRLALVLHAAEHGAGAHNQLVQEQTVTNAIRLVDWFCRQQLDSLEATRDDAWQDRRGRIMELVASCPDGITPRTVQRKRLASSADEARWALGLLVKEGVLISESTIPERGGHEVTVYRQAA